jgi:glyoxylase-like metal-dependent hydrolase (beta-lactamase superfamily II)
MGLDVTQLPLGPVQTNCYLVRQPGSAEAVVIDPSGSAAEIRLELAGRGARCVAILVTHGHWDHLGGLAELAEGTSAPVYAPVGDRELIERPNDFAPSGVHVRAHTPDTLLRGGETLELAGITFETIAVPGHTPGHLAFAADGCLFSGDVLFAGSVGRTDLPGADWDTLLGSIATLLDRLPPETTVYSGHGARTTLERELRTNPFLEALRYPEQAGGRATEES